jgi:hypothetical protein
LQDHTQNSAAKNSEIDMIFFLNRNTKKKKGKTFKNTILNNSWQQRQKLVLQIST